MGHGPKSFAGAQWGNASVLRRDCCCICKDIPGIAGGSQLSGVNVWDSEQSEQAVGVAADLRAWSFPKAFSSFCPAGFKPKEFLVACYYTYSQWPPWFPWENTLLVIICPLGQQSKLFTYCCLWFWPNQVRDNGLKHLLNFTSLLSHSKQRTERGNTIFTDLLEQNLGCRRLWEKEQPAAT